jgi:hypothetical protein
MFTVSDLRARGSDSQRLESSNDDASCRVIGLTIASVRSLIGECSRLPWTIRGRICDIKLSGEFLSA